MRFSYVKFDEIAAAQQNQLRLAFEAVEFLVEKLASSDCKEMIFEKLQEAYMWAGKHIREDQIARDPSSEHP